MMIPDRNNIIKRITTILDDINDEEVIILLPVYETVQVLKDTLALLKPDKPECAVITCAECKYWDPESGLTARKCFMNNTITTQREWCSRAVRRAGNA